MTIGDDNNKDHDVNDKLVGANRHLHMLKYVRAWLDWILNECGPRIWCVIQFTGAFGLRMGEAVA